jgi:hypothetical protein
MKMNYKRIAISLVIACLLLIGSFKSLTFSQNKPHTVNVELLGMQRSNPVPVRIKAVSVRGDENWLRDYKIELENISDKPIYFAMMLISFPQLKSHANPHQNLTTRLQFGRTELYDYKVTVVPTDVALLPGAKTYLAIPARLADSLKRYAGNKGLTMLQIKQIQIKPVSVTFGDGSGWYGGAIASTQMALNSPAAKFQKVAYQPCTDCPTPCRRYDPVMETGSCGGCPSDSPTGFDLCYNYSARMRYGFVGMCGTLLDYQNFCCIDEFGNVIECLSYEFEECTRVVAPRS